mgnify:CR=1 FL=1
MQSTIKEKIKYIELTYANLIYFMFSLIIVYILIEPQYFNILKTFIAGLSKYGILGIFASGAAYTLSFTGPIAAMVIYIFGEYYSPFLIAGVGAAGSLVVDLFIYTISERFLTDTGAVKKLRTKMPAHNIIKTMAPVIGFLIIASPLPDEIGVSFMSVMRTDRKRFILISYFSNFIGILFFAALGSAL